ncbi:preATP grasp domain-containing protein [Actinophytocola sediminis]
MNFATRLKLALVGDQHARFVYLNNFEVERSWARGEPSLPGAGIAFAATTVNRMEELGVLLAGDEDVVVLKAPVDPGYAGYLAGLGAAAGRTLWAENSDPARTVTEDALASPELIAALRALADGRTYLMPLGISPAEEQLAKETGLPLAGPSAQTCKAVNGKIFSRRLVERHGLTGVPGAVVETADQLDGALREHLPPGGKAVVKESLGVSGRGMVVLDDQDRAQRLVRMVLRRNQGARVDYVVERWIDKVLDLNYQVIVSRRGEVSFEAVKAAVVDQGVHKGHMFPVELTVGQLATLTEAGEVIGRALFAEGYFGVVGIDAMLGRDGTVYPCLEINARFNMSTYQSRIAERFVGDGRHAVAATIGLRPHRRHTFEEVTAALGDLLHDGSDRPGFLINNFATLNAAATDGTQFHGRIYGICIADDPAGALALRADVERALSELVATP